MANTPKYIAPRHAPGRQAPVPVVTGAPETQRLSPRVEGLRKLIESGQYQVSARYLAYRIFKAAGVKAE